MSQNQMLLHRICRFLTTSAQLPMLSRPTTTERNDKYSEKFMNKVELWPVLLRAETEKQMEKLKEMIKNQEEWSSVEKKGLCITNLELVTMKYDLFSGWNVVLTSKEQKPLPRWMKSSTPITLSRLNKNNDLVRISGGHIIKYDKTSIKCSIYDIEPNIEIGGDYIIFPSSSSTIVDAFEKIKNKPDDLSVGSKHLVNLAFGAVQMSEPQDSKMESLAETLNESQIAAVSAVMNSQRNLLCIQGPPGTGKTRVIAECVVQLIEKEQQVVICAPTHVAVTNVYNATIRRMKENGWKQEMIEKNLLSITEGYYDLLKQHSNYPRIVEKLKLMNSQQTKITKEVKALIESQIRELKNEIYWDTFCSKMAIFSTVHNSIVKRLYQYGFVASTVIIDEAAQCTEPATWFPILSTPHCKKMVLVGDHKQLPAVVLSNTSKT